MAKEYNVIDCNPFFVYIASFLLPVFLYQLDWSYLYPPLSWTLVIFLFITFVISLSIGLYINHKNALRYTGIVKKVNFKWILIGLTMGNVLDFLYQKEIPLFSIVNLVSQDNYGYFGIPTFAVFISTLGSFTTVYLFNYFLVTKEKKYLLGSLYLFLFPILIFSRGTILMNLSSMLFLYLFSVRKNKYKVYLKLTVLILIVLMGFGYAGNLRSNNQGQKSTDDDAVSSIMLELGQAKPSFEKSSIPRAFFWSYIYISSPLANLQQNINTNNFEYSTTSLFRYINYELIFDSISKRVGEIVGVYRGNNNLVAPYLTVGTVYSGSYTSFGWLGMCITFMFLMLITFLFIVILKPQNPFFASGIAILCTFMLFNLFDNMISFTAIGFQLVYPFIFSIKLKKI